MERKPLQIPYGISDFKRIRNEGYYFVDKSAFIRTLELSGSFLFFVRPRRFGKSLFLNMLRCYYDLAEKDNFDALFGDLDIGKAPTENRNRYQVLTLDFSQVNKGPGKTLEERFASYIGGCLDGFVRTYADMYGESFVNSVLAAQSADKFNMLVLEARRLGYHLYLMLDEYDNFTNAMLRAEGNVDYRSITHGQGFYREWFKSFKGNFDRIFMTGVSPVTMDDLTSGFNIASNISQDELCNAMVGFSEKEVLKLYTDFKGTGMYKTGEPADFVRDTKPWYDGYCFAEDKRGKETVFNSDMSLYFLNSLVKTGKPPKDWVDRNIATDYDKLETIADIQRRIDPERAENVMSPIEALAAEGEICFPLKESFDADAIKEPDNFLSLFYYYGIITMKERREGADWFKGARAPTGSRYRTSASNARCSTISATGTSTPGPPTGRNGPASPACSRIAASGARSLNALRRTSRTPRLCAAASRANTASRATCRRSSGILTSTSWPPKWSSRAGSATSVSSRSATAPPTCRTATSWS